MICALLLGREASAGFPGKNWHPLLGRAMMTYPLLAARATPSIDRVYVSTDSPRIREIGVSHGARIIDRPTHLASKEALGEDAFAHGYTVIRDELAREGETVELVVLLFCNAPTVSADALQRGIDALRRDPAADSAVTVSVYNMWSPLRARRLDERGYLQPFVPFETFGDPATLNCDRDSQGDVYFADMGASIVRPHCLERLHEGLLPQKWMGQRILPIKQWGGLDVDYEWQVPLAEHWLRVHGFSETATPYAR
jgi:CMP-N-acetylneuraminic acid synthetase